MPGRRRIKWPHLLHLAGQRIRGVANLRSALTDPTRSVGETLGSALSPFPGSHTDTLNALSSGHPYQSPDGSLGHILHDMQF